MIISILGCGWLGLALGSKLVGEGHIVKGSTTRNEKLSDIEEQGISPYIIEITEQNIVGDLEEFLNADVLFINIPPGRKRTDVAELYPKEISRLLEAVECSPIKKIVFASSTGVYGNNGGKLVSESDIPSPVSESGKAKARAEAVLQQTEIIDWVILRFAGLSGLDRQAGKWFAGKKDLPGGNARVNMVHREDCIRVIQEIINKDISGEIFNVCADEHPRKRDFYKEQAFKLNLEAPSFSEEDFGQFKIVSNKKIKEILNFEFLHPDPMKF